MMHQGCIVEVSTNDKYPCVQQTVNISFAKAEIKTTFGLGLSNTNIDVPF